MTVNKVVQEWGIDLEACRFAALYIKFVCLLPKDLEPMIGSRGRVSEVLDRKRPLNLAMVWRLHLGLGIAAESLIRQSVRAA